MKSNMLENDSNSDKQIVELLIKNKNNKLNQFIIRVEPTEGNKEEIVGEFIIDASTSNATLYKCFNSRFNASFLYLY